MIIPKTSCPFVFVDSMKSILLIISGVVVVIIVAVLFLTKSGADSDFVGMSSMGLQSSTPAPIQAATGTAGPSVAQRPGNVGTGTLNVPFTSQAPDGDWSNPLFQDGCEEASIIMAMHWVKGEPLIATKAKAEILAISDFEQREYGSAVDRSAKDTAQLIRDYYSYTAVNYVENIDAEDIKSQLNRGNVVILPMNGRQLANPYYTAPGPERHMLVVIGYDPTTREFITNDPGTRRGAKYRYKESIFVNAIRDYPTGNHELIVSIQKNMVVVSR